MLDFHDQMINPDLGSLKNRQPVTVLDSSTSTLPSPGASLTADGLSMSLGQRALFTGLSTGNNMFYKVEGYPGHLYFQLDTSGFNPSGEPTEGEFTYVNAGTHKSMMFGWNGQSFVRIDFKNLAAGTLASSDLTAILGYTPLNKAGDTMGGNLNMGGFAVTDAVSPLRVALTSPVTLSAATDKIVVSNLTVAGAVAVSLPASPATGLVFMVKDGKGDAATNNITITPAAGTIDGASTLVLSSNYAHATLVYNGTQWNQI